MASGRGLFAVISGAVIVAVGLAVVYLLVIAPRNEHRKMQQEVEALAQRWAEVRACFYGAEPRSSDPPEALIARELSVPGFATELAVCDESLRRARRADGPSSGDPVVEDAWDGLREARRTLGQALAIRLQRPRPAPMATLRARLAKAAVEAEAAYAALREAAGLAPDPLDGGAIARATPRPIEIGGAPADEVWVENNAILAASRDKGGERTLRVIDGSDAAPIAAGPGEVVGFGGRWVVALEVAGERATLVAREIDSEPPRRVEIAKLGSGARISGALGNGRGKRVVGVYDPKARELALYRSLDAGASWRREVLATELRGWPTRALFPLQRRLILSIGATEGSEVASSRPGFAGSGRPFSIGATEGSEVASSRPGFAGSGRPFSIHPERRFEIGGPELAVAARPAYATSCFGETVSWWLDHGGLAWARAGEELAPVAGSEEMPWLVNSCTDAQALGVAPVDPGIELPAHELRLCNRDGCRISARLPRAREARVAAVIAPLAGPAIAFEIDGVAVLWAGASDGSGLSPKTWMRLPDKAQLLGLVERAGAVEAVIRTASGFALARFP